MSRPSFLSAALVAGIVVAVGGGGYGLYAIFRAPPKRSPGKAQAITGEPRSGGDGSGDRKGAAAMRPISATGTRLTPGASGSSGGDDERDEPERRAGAVRGGDDPDEPGRSGARPGAAPGNDPAAYQGSGESGSGGPMAAVKGLLGGASGGADLPLPRPTGGGSGCPGGMVDVGSFCIDPTEVTNAAYAAFLATRPSLRSQPPQCAWNKTFEPPPGPPPSDQRPVTQVDWCDAHAYCASVGKRLCGRVGGGPSPFGDFADADSNEWFHVCSNGGTTTYAYGNDVDAARCAIPEQPVASAPGCVGTKAPFDAVFDMSSGVWEWEDSCYMSKGPGDTCRIRGGSAMTAATDTTCNKDSNGQRDAVSANVGIRCCADHLP